MHPSLPDQSVRDRIRFSLAETLVVEGAAGTGKTSELATRIVSLVTTATARMANVVVVTFTEKASEDLKRQLRIKLDRARRRIEPDGELAARMTLAIEELESASIGTIHGLCEKILKTHAIDALVSPRFEVAPNDQADALFNEAFDNWFSAIQANPPEGVRRFLRRRTRGFNPSGPSEQLREAARQLVEYRDFPASWTRPTFKRTETMAALVKTAKRLGATAARAKKRDDWLAKSLTEIKRWSSAVARLEADSPRDHDGLEALLRELSRQKSWGWKGTGRWYGKDLPRARVLDERQRFKTSLDTFVATSEADIVALLHEELAPVVVGYERLKARTGLLDGLDLLFKTRQLLRDDDRVRRALQRQFSHLLVDEFQETNPLQAEILLLLSAKDPGERDWAKTCPVPGKLFLSGDPKQAVCRHQRGDLSLYRAVKEQLVGAGASILILRASFRATPEIQRAINAAFSQAMVATKDATQADYVPLEPVRNDPLGQPAVIALPVPAPFNEWGQLTSQAINTSLPDAVGGFVDWLLNDSGWTVTEPHAPEKKVPVQAQHICLLFKRLRFFRDDIARPYLDALEARGITYAPVAGSSWHAREEVLALRTALTAIEWPDDELNVFATLHGPFFALSDESLLAFRAAFEAPNPLHSIDEQMLTPLTYPVFDALKVIAELHRQRNNRPLADTVSMLLELTRAHAGVALWHAGEQTLGSLFEIVDAARRFEAAGATSFRSFVEKLELDAERAGSGETPNVETGAGGVRVMTARGAKGHEFPVVILCDPTAPQTPHSPSFRVDADARLRVMPLAGCVPAQLEEHRFEALLQDEEETVRLAYVAATRARDLLVIPSVGEVQLTGWLKPLQTATSPRADSKNTPTPAPGCPPFGDDSILIRPPRRRQAENAVRPGRHLSVTGTHHVVWWDPHQLRLGAKTSPGLRRQELLESDEPDSSESRWKRWQQGRKETLETATLPSTPQIQKSRRIER